MPQQVVQPSNFTKLTHRGVDQWHTCCALGPSAQVGSRHRVDFRRTPRHGQAQRVAGRAAKVLGSVCKQVEELTPVELPME
jgi:hypothetical protein